MPDIYLDTTTRVAPVQPSAMENSAPEANWIKINRLVAKMMASDHIKKVTERTQTDQLKAKYKATSLEVANLQRELGWSNIKFAGVAFVSSFCQLSPYESDKAIGNIFSSQFCPKLGELYASNINANTSQASNMTNLLLQEYQAKVSKGSSDASSMQEFTGVLDKALDSLKRAAQAG